VGLYLAKTVIAMHGGDITVSSEEGQGSCFEIRLPHAPDADRQVGEMERSA
jgi:signal transduction histidine kinase